VGADVLKHRTIFGGKLKDNPHIVFNGKTPILLQVARKFVRPQPRIEWILTENFQPLPKFSSSG
jgi:hypothetical protein